MRKSVFIVAAVVLAAVAVSVSAELWAQKTCTPEALECGGSGTSCTGSSCEGCTGSGAAQMCLDQYDAFCEGCQCTCGHKGTGTCSSGVCVRLVAPPDAPECNFISCGIG